MNILKTSNLPNDFNLSNYKNIHFIGIGGSGMCPLAEILNSEGFFITGSDMNVSDTLERIVKEYGIKVYMEHKEENVQNVDLIVYSAAIKQSNPELVYADKHNIPVMERCDMLGVVAKRYNRSIAVSGTHGKTSTTAMITQILIGSGFNPSAIIGGKLPYIGGNSYIGDSDIMVCEACEYVNSFLSLTPAISIILNVDADHLDFFKDLDDIKKSFNKFAKQTGKLLVINGDDKNSRDAIKDIETEKIFFGFNSDNDYYAENLKMVGASSTFDLMSKGEKLTTITLNVPGKHNVMNSLAAISVALYLKTSPKLIAENLNKFSGVHRRFEILGNPCGITVADDFAHHPTELTVTLNAAMNMGFKRVWAVFQPHTYSRTSMLLDDFAKALSIPDKLVMSEILAVREENTYNIYTKDLADKVDGSVWFNTFEEINDYICKNAESGDLVLTLGGGNVYMCANMIYKSLQAKEMTQE